MKTQELKQFAGKRVKATLHLPNKNGGMSMPATEGKLHCDFGGHICFVDIGGLGHFTDNGKLTNRGKNYLTNKHIIEIEEI